MCLLRDSMIVSSKSEGMNGTGDGSNNAKKCYLRNWQLSVGLLVFSITMILKHSVGLPDFLQGFGEGLSIALMLFGLLASAGKSACGLIKRRVKLCSR